MQVVKIQSTRYAIGLWWQILQGLPSSQSGQAAALRHARRTSAVLTSSAYTCAALRKNQCGLGSKRGRIPRVRSLAAAIAQGQKGQSVNVLAVFLLSPQGPWWVCAIKDGIIAAEGDHSVDSYEKAMAHANQLQSVLAMDAPEVYQDVAASQARLKVLIGKKSLLAGLVGDGRVVTLRSTRRYLRIVGTTILVLISMFMLYSLGFFSDDSAALAAREARRMEILAHPERFFPRPWREVAKPVPWAGRCLKYLMDLPTADSGWDLEKSQCLKENFETQWTFVSGASFMQLPAGTSLQSPKKAVRKANLPPLKAAAKPDELVGTEEVARKLYEIANLFGLHLTLTWSQPAKTTVREGRLAVPLTAPWRVAKWGFSDLPAQIILSPEFYAVLDSIPGLVLEEVTHTNGKWEIKGICHGR